MVIAFKHMVPSYVYTLIIIIAIILWIGTKRPKNYKPGLDLQNSCYGIAYKNKFNQTQLIFRFRGGGVINRVSDLNALSKKKKTLVMWLEISRQNYEPVIFFIAS